MRGKRQQWQTVGGKNRRTMMENKMLRVISAGAVLFMLASTVAASEHYVEVWNPPESRLVKPTSQNNKLHSGKPALIAHTMPKIAARRVAAPQAKAAPVKHVSSGALRKTVSPTVIDIPRIMTPEGNVLRVSGGSVPVSVVR